MMKPLKPITCRVDELISVDKFAVDEENAHIELDCENLSELDAIEFGKLIRVCPAGLYREDDNGERAFDYAGCLECGTCRIACEATIVKKWNQPAAFCGVSYRFG